MTVKRKKVKVWLSNLRGRRKATQSAQNFGNGDGGGISSPPPLPTPGPSQPSTLDPSQPSTSKQASLPASPAPRPRAPAPKVPSQPSSLELRKQFLKKELKEEKPVPKTKKLLKEENPDPKNVSLFSVSQGQLNALIGKRKCPWCGVVSGLRVQFDRGVLQTECQKCHGVATCAPPPSYSSQGRSYSIKGLREVFIGLISGTGFAELRLNESCLTGTETDKNSFITCCRLLYREMNSFCQEKLKESREAVFKIYREKLERKPDQSGVLDVDVSYDGSWMDRGKTSHIAIGFAVEVFSGFVMDMDVLCNYCRVCSSMSEKKHGCQKNFDGKSGAMEDEIAVRIWSRTSDYRMRFTTFVGDGDSSAYNAVCQLNEGRGPYPVPVEKEECINHFSKRLGTRLRKIKAVKRKREIGASMLTETELTELSEDYAKAIREHRASVQGMQKAVWASFHHQTSTTQDPCHQLCPEGAKSWCFYNRAVALNLPECDRDHENKNLHLAKMPKEKLEHVQQIYRDLGHPDLLKRCQKGATQNPDATLHSKVWSKCPKTRFYGRPRVRFLVQLTAVSHNFGYDEKNILVHLLRSDAKVEQGPQRSKKATRKRKRELSVPQSRQRKARKVSGEDGSAEVVERESEDGRNEQTVMLKRKRGRPRKKKGGFQDSELVEVDYGDGKRTIMKRKRGRPRKNENVMETSESIQTSEDYFEVELDKVKREGGDNFEVYVDVAEEPERYSEDSDTSPRVQSEIQRLDMSSRVQSEIQRLDMSSRVQSEILRLKEDDKAFVAQEWNWVELDKVQKEIENVSGDHFEVKCEVEDEELVQEK